MRFETSPCMLANLKTRWGAEGVTLDAIPRCDQGARPALSCLRTAAAELPTLSMARANSSLVTPKCRVQYLTWSSCSKTILLRSGVIVLVIIFGGLWLIRKPRRVRVVPLDLPMRQLILPQRRSYSPASTMLPGRHLVVSPQGFEPWTP